MTGREWKPGDVAMVALHDGSSSRAIRRHDGTWRLSESCVDRTPAGLDAFRPLVVIDPEDPEQVARFGRAFHKSFDAGDESAMQAALRSLIETPRPEEPKGIGAVVRDAGGDYWCRNAGGRWLNLDGGTSFTHWRDMTTDVEIISEGVR